MPKAERISRTPPPSSEDTCTRAKLTRMWILDEGDSDESPSVVSGVKPQQHDGPPRRGDREVRVLSRAFRENPGAAGEDSHSAVTRARAGSPQGQPAGTREPRGEKPAGHRYRRLRGNWSVRPSLRRRRRRRRSVAVAQQAEPPVVGRVVRVQIPPVTLLAGRRASVLGGQVKFEPSSRASLGRRHARHDREALLRKEQSNAPHQRRTALLSAPANGAVDSPASNMSRPGAA